MTPRVHCPQCATTQRTRQQWQYSGGFGVLWAWCLCGMVYVVAYDQVMT